MPRRRAWACDVRYDAEVVDLEFADGRFRSASGPSQRPRRAGPGENRGAGGGRIRIQPRMAQGDLGRRGRQLHRSRHAVQQGHGSQGCCSTAARSASAMRRSAMRSRSTRERRSSTAASSPGSTASRSASWSTSTDSAFTTKARTSGRSATRSGGGSWRSSRIKLPIRSSIPRRSASSCRRCFPLSPPTRFPSSRGC